MGVDTSRTLQFEKQQFLEDSEMQPQEQTAQQVTEWFQPAAPSIDESSAIHRLPKLQEYRLQRPSPLSVASAIPQSKACLQPFELQTQPSSNQVGHALAVSPAGPCVTPDYVPA